MQIKSLMIKNLCPGLAEVGKIKIGNKGRMITSKQGNQFQPPQKLDHFIITTLERGQDGNFVVDKRLMDRFGENCKSIPVRLIYDDPALNFMTRLICYNGRTVWCCGDNETAMRLQEDGKTYAPVTCPCERIDPKFTGRGKCKFNGVLSVIVEGADIVGGVWKFRTTSYNSVVGIMSSMALIMRITGGKLAGIPLNMTVSPKTVQNPVDGSQQTIQVVGLVFAGSIPMLRESGLRLAIEETQHGVNMMQIEEKARSLMSNNPPSSGLGDDSAEDVIEEWYPEEVTVIAGDDAMALGATGETEAKQQYINEPITTEPPKRERGKPSLGKQRRTAAEVEEDRIADERDAAAVHTTDPPVKTGRQIPDPECTTDESDWPDPPQNSKEAQTSASVDNDVTGDELSSTSDDMDGGDDLELF